MYAKVINCNKLVSGQGMIIQFIDKSNTHLSTIRGRMTENMICRLATKGDKHHFAHIKLLNCQTMPIKKFIEGVCPGLNKSCELKIKISIFAFSSHNSQN